MKKLFFIIWLISTICSCKKDSQETVPQSQQTQATRSNYIVLIIARGYVSFDSLSHTDSILSTSYWRVNNNKKYFPVLPTISAPGVTQAPGYEEFKDTLDAVIGDSVTVILNLKHSSSYEIGSGFSAGGIFIDFYQEPGGFKNYQFMCTGDTVSQTISFKIQ